MKLIKQEKEGCVYASLAMVLSESLKDIYRIFKYWEITKNYPFTGKWAITPRVPGMEEICDISWRVLRKSFVPFSLNPTVTPDENCKPIQVWESPTVKFNSQLSYGTGLIEGLHDGIGHMVAWDGSVVYDPHGYCYSINVSGRFNFQPRRFWLLVN